MPPKATDNRLRRHWQATLPDHVIDLAWSPNGRFIAAASISGPVTIFSAEKGTPVATLTGHAFGTMAIAWKPNGELLATAGQDGKIRIWDATLWQERAALDGGASWVEHLAFASDGLLASAAGKKVRIWDHNGEMKSERADFAATVSDLAWRGSQLSVASYGSVKLFDATLENVALEFPWKGAPLKLAWSPNGAMLAHGNQDATIHFWLLAKPKFPLQMSGFSTKIRELSWDATSRYLACGGSPAVCIWDCGGAGPEGSKPTLLNGHDAPLTALAWQRRGFLIASGGPEGLVNLWQPANKKGQPVGKDLGAAGVTTLAWSPDDRSLAVGGDDGTLRMLKIH